MYLFASDSTVVQKNIHEKDFKCVDKSFTSILRNKRFLNIPWDL